MKVYWWQDGVHIKPESQEERQALFVLTEGLDFVGIKAEIQSGPIGAIQRSDQESVVRVDESLEIIP